MNADGAVLEPERSDQMSAEVDRDGRPVILIIQDQQLVDDPELLRPAGAAVKTLTAPIPTKQTCVE